MTREFFSNSKMLPRLFTSLLDIQGVRINIAKLSLKALDTVGKLATREQNIAAHPRRSKFVMEKVYMRHENNSSELHINFRYTNPELRIDRDFNFCRKIDEKVNDALTRIRNNIEKELTKRSKKLKKLPESIEIKSIPVEIYNVAAKESPIVEGTFAELLNCENKNQLYMRVLDSTFAIVYNQPWIVNLVMPSSCMAGFIVYPSRLELKFANTANSRAKWYRSKMPTSGDIIRGGDWTHIADGLCYETTNQDIGYHLMIALTPGNSANEFGPEVEGIMKRSVEPGPGICPFKTRHQFTKERLQGDEFRVVSYNLLADLYADSDYSRNMLFPYCPAYILKMEYRKQLFLKELRGYNADIMCLQEVDVKIFEHDLKPVFDMPDNGFKGILTQKGTCGEGVAIFYRKERYELIKTYGLLIGDQIPKLPEFAELYNKIKDNKALLERICDRSTTLQICLLKCKASGRLLLVANTHLYFHPDADHIRLLQVGFSWLYVKKIYKEVTNDFSSKNNIGIIFCGDFNSTPECGIYKLMTEQYVPADFEDWRSNADEAVKNIELSQPFRMSSACGTPPFTNYTEGFAACLDYIFYQYSGFKVKQVVPLPSEEELKEHTAIPSVVFPSDHVALVADLKIL